MPTDDTRYTRFSLHTGDTWAGSMPLRHLYRVSGPLPTPRVAQWDMRADMTDVPVGTTIKLCGLAYVSPQRWQRVLKAGWRHALSFTHEDSDRVLLTRTRHGLKLRTYVYRLGVGAVTHEWKKHLPYIDEWSETLCFIPEGQHFAVRLRPTDEGTHYECVVGDPFATDAHGHPNRRTLHQTFVPRRRTLPYLAHRTFAHAHGHEQDESPGTIHIDLER